MRRIVLRRYSARAPRSGLRLRLASRGTLAEPFGLRRIVGHESGLRRTRIFTNRSIRLCEGIRSKPHSCSFVSGEAPHSCPEASATSRRQKRRGEARRRSFGLSSLLQVIVLVLDLQAVRRRGVSRGEAVSQMRRGSWSRVSASNGERGIGNGERQRELLAKGSAADRQMAALSFGQWQRYRSPSGQVTLSDRAVEWRGQFH